MDAARWRRLPGTQNHSGPRALRRHRRADLVRLGHRAAAHRRGPALARPPRRLPFHRACRLPGALRRRRLRRSCPSAQRAARRSKHSTMCDAVLANRLLLPWCDPSALRDEWQLQCFHHSKRAC